MLSSMPVAPRPAENIWTPARTESAEAASQNSSPNRDKEPLSEQDQYDGRRGHDRQDDTCGATHRGRKLTRYHRAHSPKQAFTNAIQPQNERQKRRGHEPDSLAGTHLFIHEPDNSQQDQTGKEGAQNGEETESMYLHQAGEQAPLTAVHINRAIAHGHCPQPDQNQFGNDIGEHQHENIISVVVSAQRAPGED